MVVSQSVPAISASSEGIISLQQHEISLAEKLCFLSQNWSVSYQHQYRNISVISYQYRLDSENMTSTHLHFGHLNITRKKI